MRMSGEITADLRSGSVTLDAAHLRVVINCVDSTVKALPLRLEK